MACDPLDPNYDECVAQEAAAQTGTGTGTTGAGSGTPSPDDTFGGIGESTKARTTSIPGNLTQPIIDLARAYGMDPRLLAAAIQQKTRWRKAEITEANLERIAQAIADEFKRVTTPSAAAVAAAGGRRIPSPLDPRTAWLTAAGNVTGVTANDIENLVTKDPTIAGDLAIGGAAKQPLIPGLSDDAAYAVQRVADSLFIQYTGKLPSNEEYINIANAGWTTDTVETWLRAQPHPAGGTVGAYNDVQTAARKSAQQWLGRDPDAGELAYLVAQGFKSTDQIDAYYNQLKQRRDTGDPAFAWVGDPDQWRNTQSQIEALWKKAGLTSQVDPHLVNQAVTGGWTVDDIQSHIDALSAPGFAQGVTVGEVNRVRGYAKHWKEEFAPGDPLTTAELSKFLNMTSEEVEGYYRQMPLQPHLDALRRAKQMPTVVTTGAQGTTTTTTGNTTTKPKMHTDIGPEQVKKDLSIVLSGPGAGANVETPGVPG